MLPENKKAPNPFAGKMSGSKGSKPYPDKIGLGLPYLGKPVKLLLII